jgi:hypothetical protein
MSTELAVTWFIATHDVFIDLWVYVHFLESVNAEKDYCDILYHNPVEAL